MSASITAYDEDNLPFPTTLSDSLEDILDTWAQPSLVGSHPDITGTFSGTADNSWPSLFGTALSGSSYTYGSDEAGFKWVATGDLYYYFNSTYTPVSGSAPDDHTVFGTLDSLSLYTDSDADGQADDLFLTVSFSPGIEGDVADGHANPVHVVLADLQNGSVTELESLLTNQGIDITDSLADLVGSSALADNDLLLAA